MLTFYLTSLCDILIFVLPVNTCFSPMTYNFYFKGTVEIEEQVEGLEKISAQCPLIDLDRIAIHGWSYGEYPIHFCIQFS